MPKKDNLRSRISWSTQSNAFDKSKKRTATISLLSSASWILSRRLMHAEAQLENFRNPYCLCEIRLNLSKKELSLERMTF